MFVLTFTVHEGLRGCGRFPRAAVVEQTISVAQFGWLMGLGLAAAIVSVYLKPSFGVPGSNIVYVVFPMALGLAMVPRHGAASVMGSSAMVTACLLVLAGSRIGFGAAVSLALTGFLIDVALHNARSGRGIYVRLMAAGLAANLVAFGIRAAAKVIFGPGVTGKPLALWWQHAAVTYAACGLLAGMIRAAVWFRYGSQSKTTCDGGAVS